MAQNDQFDDQQEPLLDENGNPIEELPPEDEEKRSKYAGIISWVVSGTMHLTLIGLLTIVVFLAKEEEKEIPPVRVNQIPPPPEKPKEKERTVDEPKIELDIVADNPTPNPLSVVEPVEDVTTREEENESTQPKGREEAVADSEMGGSGAFMAIGAGGGSAGMFGFRNGGGKRRAVGKGGGSKGSESAVDAALRWFKKHQSPNGQWDAENYYQNCTEDPKCEPGTLGGRSAEETNTAMTGYALLAFLGAGYDHKTPNKFKATVKKGIDYLVSIQKPDGLLGLRNYEHPVAAMALAEAYAMTSDPDLKTPAQNAINVIIARQNKGTGGDSAYAGLGWDYTEPNASRNDASVSGWNVMALKSAYAGGLSVGNAMEGAKKYLDRAWKDTNTGQPWCADPTKLDPYTGISRFPYTWDGAGGFDISKWGANGPATPQDAWEHSMEPVGMVLAVFLGHRAGDPMLESLANYVVKYQLPTGYPTNTYYMYYNTLGIFQVGGEKWKTWNGTVRDMLVKAQRRGEGCFDGSWDFTSKDFHGSDIGRVLSTAYNTLCLEVYYRYAMVNKAN